MFGKWKSLANLRRGLEMSLTMNLFGLPEVLVIHSKYEAATTVILKDLVQYKIRAVVLILDPESVCEDCASESIRRLSRQAYPDAESLVTVKYFGIPREYVETVSDKVNASC